MKRITIKDIAKLMQVAPSTVSRALSDHPDISFKTRQAVKMLAEELGYTPNNLAANFRKQNSGLLALILPEIQMFFFPEVIRGIEEYIRNTGFSLLLFHSNNSLQLEIDNIRRCMQYPVDGVILSLTSETANLEHLNPLIKLEIPVLLYDRILPNALVSTLTINDREAVSNAVKLLLQNGHQKIMGLFGNQNLYISQVRMAGFKSTLMEHGLSINPKWTLYIEQFEDLSPRLSPILSQPSPPTAIFAMSDELLLKTMALLSKNGLNIPGDIEVVCFSEGYFPSLSFPKVSHIKHSGYDVGKKAAEMLLDLIRSKNLKTLNHEMDLELVKHS